ncbi:MAG: hypothetical protein V3S26_03510, partial [Acidimicrobiia bacterium]
WQGRGAALGVVVAVILAMQDVLIPAIALPLLVVAAALAWWLTDGFWTTVAFGLAGGVIAGLLIMGPGFRVAMRVVAIMDPIRTPEFSVGGTGFIIVGIGGILGGVMGILGNLIRKAAAIASAVVAGVVLGAFEMTILLIDSGLREEFFELGGGPWVNIPMFAVFAFGYGIAAMTIADRLDHRASKSVDAGSEKEPAGSMQTSSRS